MEKRMEIEKTGNEEALLEEIIVQQAVYPVYQPIVSLQDGRILGYEGLSRVKKDGVFPNVEDMFKAAERTGRIWQLEQVCRKAVLQGIYEQQREFEAGSRQLFLNVNPKVLHDTKFRVGFTGEYLRRFHIDTEKVVFEVTERESVENKRDFENAINHYKEQGYHIAIDDVGSGYAGLNLICSLMPHYIKLDMQLVHNIFQNPVQYAMVKGLVEFSVNSGILLIAEGIETKKELDMLIDLGVQYGQGYYLYRPSSLLQKERQELCKEIKEKNYKKHSKNYMGLGRYHIKNLISPGITVTPGTKVAVVQEYIIKNEDVLGVCVVEEGKVLGILTREKLMKQLSGRYGFSLNHNKTMLELAEKNFLKAEGESSVSSVARLAMEREADSLYDFIVVTDKERYAGIVTVRNLLKKATEIDMDAAKSANPLTGLPGNMVIDEKIRQCVEGKDSYTVYYLDLDNFKAFNDVYGFERGDEVILLLSEVLKKNIGEGDFVGHIGGDDFVAIRYGKEEKDFAWKVRRQFEERAHRLYSEEDRRRGSILAKNRHGVMEQFPLVSVTIVSVSDKDGLQRTGKDVVEILAKYKKEEKAKKRFVS